MILAEIHVNCTPRQLRHGNASPAGGMGETKGKKKRGLAKTKVIHKKHTIAKACCVNKIN